MCLSSRAKENFSFVIPELQNTANCYAMVNDSYLGPPSPISSRRPLASNSHNSFGKKGEIYSGSSSYRSIMTSHLAPANDELSDTNRVLLNISSSSHFTPTRSSSPLGRGHKSDLCLDEMDLSNNTYKYVQPNNVYKN